MNTPMIFIEEILRWFFGFDESRVVFEFIVQLLLINSLKTFGNIIRLQFSCTLETAGFVSFSC